MTSELRQKNRRIAILGMGILVISLSASALGLEEIGRGALYAWEGAMLAGFLA